MHQVMIIEIGDVKKDEARKGGAMTSPVETSMDSAVKADKPKNYNPH